MAKKSYNPFKMWGSYLGATITLFIPFKISSGTSSIETINLFHIFSLLDKLTINGIVESLFGILVLISGFLIGWGIHSLIRKFKN